MHGAMIKIKEDYTRNYRIIIIIIIIIIIMLLLHLIIQITVKYCVWFYERQT